MSREAVRRAIISSPQDVLRRIGGGITPLNFDGATESTTSGVDDRRGRSGMLSFKLSVRFGAEFNHSLLLSM